MERRKINSQEIKKMLGLEELSTTEAGEIQGGQNKIKCKCKCDCKGGGEPSDIDAEL